MPRQALSTKPVSKHLIPDKLYFKIGEVADLVGLKPYVLRYWETEFREIGPVKSRTNQRLYKRRDVEMIFKIKELLYQERFTINGAKKRLKEEGERSHSDASQQILSFAGGQGDLSSKAKGQIRGELGSLIQEMMESLRD